MTTLNEKQLSIMAAILGISNAGMDSTFRGPNAPETPDSVADYYLSSPPENVEQAVMHLASHFLESQEMADNFVAEAKAWEESLRNMDVRRVRHVYSHYSKFLDALTGNNDEQETSDLVKKIKSFSINKGISAARSPRRGVISMETDDDD